ncbi:ion channel [Variibacter gotjawalensis]|uniref:Ion channel n=1 Tax=Variibacter gotjawalensis TaxID=1333996 RepID=A0A0S3Q104_9BRAD|nr:voltage-gated potassium channel [Variibacter gotjawalensis]BAT61881.1 ion channel [Variibacter gotjawalensis]
MTKLRSKLRGLYNGKTKTAVRFRFAVVAMDLAIIAFFIATPILQKTASFLWLDYSVAALLSVDIGCRMLAEKDVRNCVRQPMFYVDCFILLTLLFPSTLANLGFLRILRLWSLSRSGFLWEPLTSLGFKTWRDTGHAVVNLVTFLFITTGFVYTFFFRAGEGSAGYIDALYFTVATITTTGFGDITLPGVAGKLTSIAVMIVGLSLFVRLAQAVFRPYKVTFHCPACALQRHEPDAVHCKACGHILQLPDEGE